MSSRGYRTAEAADGFEVCKRIKENPSTSRINVLAITGHDTEENRARIMAAGADGYLIKPVDTKALVLYSKATGNALLISE